VDKPKGSDRSSTKNLYVPRRYGNLADSVIKDAKILAVSLDARSWHAILWLALFAGMQEIKKLNGCQSLAELEDIIGELYNGNS
jgi:hypothetical protein